MTPVARHRTPHSRSAATFATSEHRIAQHLTSAMKQFHHAQYLLQGESDSFI